jgi:proton-dependent oligopeptide transporter, POT family
MSTASEQMSPHPEFLGHPTGLCTIFFAEMWERFAYYGMRPLLMFYMIKGFLGYNDQASTAVYGAFIALVYMTPFLGGMLADRLLGTRRSIILGGVLMGFGYLMMAVPSSFIFFIALGLVICGNGFFKPNMSTLVGTLYPERSIKRGGGFTIFYMGVNLGAAIGPLIVAYVGETYSYAYGFSLAALGMFVGIIIFFVPTLVSRILIGASALIGILTLSGIAGKFMNNGGDPFAIGLNIIVALFLLIAGLLCIKGLGRGGLTKSDGVDPGAAIRRKPVFGGIQAEWCVYIGTAFAVILFALFVSGFAPLTEDNQPISLVSDAQIEKIKGNGAFGEVAAVFVEECSRPAGLILLVCGLAAFGYLLIETFRLAKIPRERMFVVLILTFFSLLFWAFFEQAGSSINLFTDRNVDRIAEASHVEEADVGEPIYFRVVVAEKDDDLKELDLLTQEQFGYVNDSPEAAAELEAAIRAVENDKTEGKKTEEELDELVEDLAGQEAFTMTHLTYLRNAAGLDDAPEDAKTYDWIVTKENVGMGVGGSEVPASAFQSLNPIYIVIFGLLFTMLWGFLAKKNIEPSTPVKFSFGLLQLGLGFVALWYGAVNADPRGMAVMSCLLLGYLLHTTGELCLSPVGLSMVAKLSPKRLVSTVMGAWLLASAFSMFLSAIIAQFTGVSHGGEGDAVGIPVPTETIGAYGSVFGKVAIAALISALICFLLAPFLKRWMHEGLDDDGNPEVAHDEEPVAAGAEEEA